VSAEWGKITLPNIPPSGVDGAAAREQAARSKALMNEFTVSAKR